MADEFARFNWIPARTAAKMLRVSRQRIYQLISEGKIGAITLDGVFFVSKATVEARMVYLQNQKQKYESRIRANEGGIKL